MELKDFFEKNGIGYEEAADAFYMEMSGEDVSMQKAACQKALSEYQSLN